MRNRDKACHFAERGDYFIAAITAIRAMLSLILRPTSTLRRLLIFAVCFRCFFIDAILHQRSMARRPSDLFHAVCFFAH